jgi:hypothetical protein
MATKQKALISFITFIIAVLKYVFINKLETVNPYGPINSKISWYLILPLMMVGIFLSLWVIRDNYYSRMKNKQRFIDLNFLMALPIIIFFVNMFYI